jgi:hypothetical protein
MRSPVPAAIAIAILLGTSLSDEENELNLCMATYTAEVVVALDNAEVTVIEGETGADANVLGPDLVVTTEGSAHGTASQEGQTCA